MQNRAAHLRCILVGAFLCLIGLSACADKDNAIGSTVKGDRVAVMDSTKKVDSDKDLVGQKPELSDPTSNSSWPQAGYDSTHVMPNANVGDNLHEVWRADLGAGSGSDFKLLARPIVADGHVFTMDAQGVVLAFSAKDGSKIWEFDTAPENSDENEIGGGIGIEGDVLYATTGFGEVLALKADSGKVLWRKPLFNPLRAAPTIIGDRVYAVSIDNQLNALDARTGDVLWHHNGIAESATLMGASNPATINDSVVVAYSSGEIFNLRAENGRVSWNYGLTTPTQVGALPAIADIRGLPIIDRGRVFAISHSGRMASIDLRTGDRVWENDIGGINTPVVSGDTIFVLSNDGQLLAVTRESGRILWTQELQHQEDPDDHDSDPVYWTGPTLGGGKLWLTNSLGQLVSFSVTDGSQLNSIDLDKPSFIPPVIADGVMYVVTDNGSLVALR
jgi:outer membrane protein assembly factor BamB